MISFSKLFFRIILCFLWVYFLNGQCLNQDKVTKLCDYCAYNYYSPKNSFVRNISGYKELLSPFDCIPKNGKNVSKQILISNINIASTITVPFDFIMYDNVIEAFLNETISSQEYEFTSLKFYFTKGYHMVARQNENNEMYSFFQRINCEIIIKPLFCQDYYLEDLCVGNNEIVKIILKSLQFSIFVTNRFEMYKINIDALDSILSKSEVSKCIYSKNLSCCETNFLSEENSDCYLKGKNSQIQDEKNYLFYVEKNNYDPEANATQFLVVDCKFENFFFVESSNQFINSFFSMPKSGVDFNLKLFVLSNFFTNESIINFIVSTSNIYFGGSINLQEVLIINYNNYSLFPSQVTLLDFTAFAGFLIIYKLQIGPVFNFESKSITLMRLNLLEKQFNLSDISFMNISFANLLEIDSSKGNLSNLTIKNFFFAETPIKISNSSSRFLENWSIKNVSCILESVNFFYFEFSDIKLQRLNMDIFKNFSLYIFHSSVEISYCNFSNIIISQKGKIFSFASSLKLLENNWYLIRSKIFFSYSSLDKIDFVNNNFTNCTAETFISGTSVNFLYLINTTIEDLQGIVAFIGGGATIYNFYLISSNFIKFRLAQSFATLSIGNLYMSFCVFKDFLYTTSKSNNLMQFQNGVFYILNSYFERINYAVFGNQIISLKTGDVNVANSTFYNNGWLYVVDIKTRIAMEFINVFYIWGCYDVFFYNDTYINDGGYSLFSGFIISTIHQTIFSIDSCKFIARNKAKGLSYHGVILMDSPLIFIKNNYFEGLECCDFNSIEHNNGILSLQGESSYMRKGNQKIALLENNTFFKCKCQNGGSIGIMNFLQVTITKTSIKNSSSEIKGGALEIISCLFVSVTEIKISEASSKIGAMIFVMNSQNISIDNLIGEKSNGEQGGIYAIQVKKMFLNNVQIAHSKCILNAGGFFFYGGQYLLNNVYFYNISANYNGAAFVLKDKAEICVRNLRSQYTKSQMGGLLYSFSSDGIIFENSTIFNSEAKLDGGCFFLDSLTFLNMSTSFFQNNIAESLGIVYIKTMEIYSEFYFLNLTLLNNAAKSGSFIYSDAFGKYYFSNIKIKNHVACVFYFGWSSVIPIEINDTFVIESQTGYLFWFFGVTASLNNIFIKGNIISNTIIRIDTCPEFQINYFICRNNSQLAGIYEIISSSLYLSFIDIIRKNDQFLSLFNAQNSNIVLLHSIFDSFQNNDGFILLEYSSFFIIGSYFINISGPVISGIDTTLTINNSVFLNNTEEASSASSNIELNVKRTYKSTNISIANSLFGNMFGFSMMLTKIHTISLANLVFNGYSISQGIHISNFHNLEIQDSIISNFTTNQQGASIFLSNEQDYSQVLIKNSNFSRNQAKFAGVVYFSNIDSIEINNCTFILNYAAKVAGVFLFFSLKSSNITIYDCNFENNYAHFNNPVLFSNNPLISFQNTFKNNTDSHKINNKLSTFPLHFLPKEINSMSNNTIEIVSGNANYLSFLLQDEYNQSFYSEQPLTARFIQDVDSSNVGIQNHDSLETTVGEFIFPTIIIKSIPNSTFSFILTAYVPDYEKNIIKAFKQTVAFYSRPCVKGEIFTSFLTCQKCPLYYYSLIDPMMLESRSLPCKKCENNAFCPGGSYLIPNEDYWRYSEESTKIVKCILPKACTSAIFNKTTDTNELIHGSCALGHYGNLCHECILGYGKYQSNSMCQECQSFEIWNIIRLVGICVFLIVYLIYNARTISSETNSHLNDVLMKIIINHLQKITIVTFIDLSSVVSDLQRVFSFLSVLSFITEDIFSNDCFLQDVIPNITDIYLYKTMLIIILPLAFSLACFILYVLFSLKYRTSNLGNKISIIFFISVFLFYPLITKCSLSLLNCIRLNETNNEYLYLSPNIKCWEGIHLYAFIFIGIFGILLWGLGFPIMLVFFIKRKIKDEKYKFIKGKENLSPDLSNPFPNLNDETIVTAVHFQEQSRINIITRKRRNSLSQKKVDQSQAYKFFYRDYKVELYYWESIIFTQKFGISLFQNIPKIIGQEQADLLFIFVLIVYYQALIKFKPFIIPQMNKLENFSIVCSFFSKILLILCRSYEGETIISMILSSIMIIFNVAFFTLALYYFIKLTNWKKLFDKTAKQIKNIGEKLSPNAISSLMRNSITKKKGNIQKSIEIRVK